MNQQIYDMDLMDGDTLLNAGEYDFFLLAPNIEKRSREFFLKFKEKQFFRKLVVLDYANFHVGLDEEQEKSFYDVFSIFTPVIVQARDSADAVRNLGSQGILPEDRVAIDITGFSIPDIYQMIYVLKNVIRVTCLDVFYTEPQSYVYEQGYFDAYHKNEGERSCAPVIGYYNAGEDEREVLIIFLGFDGGLADLVYFKLGEEGKEIIQTLAVNGFPSYAPKLKDVSLFNNEDLINKIEKQNVLYAAANNPFEAYNLLCMVLEQYRGTLLNLCTIGSKPMALGACLFALDHIDEVKVTYPFYEKKQFDMEEEAGKIWRYKIRF